jgi:hypothetical protein
VDWNLAETEEHSLDENNHRIRIARFAQWIAPPRPAGANSAFKSVR